MLVLLVMLVSICEIFYSLQLEGSYIGYPAAFVRFGGCNLSCDFCDTKYAKSDYIVMSTKEVYNEVKNFNCKRVIFTGGEPLLQKDFLRDFIDLYSYDFEFFLETNGTIWVEFANFFKHIALSPKFDCLEIEVLKKYSELNNVEFKILIQEACDIKNIESLFNDLNLQSATLQPVFYNNESLLHFTVRVKNIIEAFKSSNLINKDVRLIVQNHKIIYGEQRGV